MNGLEDPKRGSVTPPAPALLDYPHSMRYLGGISESKLKTLIGSGQLRVVAIGRRRMISVRELDAFIAAQTIMPADAA